MPFQRLCLITCLTALWCSSLLPTRAAERQPHALSVGENFVDPVGFYDPSTVCSWNLPVAEDVKAQTAYRIVVRNRSETNDDDADPIWDSVKVISTIGSTDGSEYSRGR